MAPTDASAPEEAPTLGRFTKWLSETDRLTGDWGGYRTKLEGKGIQFSLYYNYFFGYKDNGGRNGRSGDGHSGSVDLFGTADFEQMGLIPGGEMLIQVKNNHGYNVNDEVSALGDPIDDADGYLDIYIDQLYYQQSLWEKKFQVRVGYLDQQTILDRNAYANSEDKQFMNAYLDNNNAIIPLQIGPGISLFINPTPWVSFVLGTADAKAKILHDSLDTTFDGDRDYYGYFEADFKGELKSTRGPLQGNYRFGLLFDPIDVDKETFAKPAGPTATDVDKENEGFYVSFDQRLYNESQESKEGLGVFFRYGWRPENVNKVEHFWSAGMAYQGLVPTRNEDVLGFGVYSAIGSDRYRSRVNPDFDRETGYEVYYSAALTPAIVISPGFQYISQPGARESRPDAMVGALRVRLAF